MNKYRLHFTFRGAFIVIEVHHDDKGQFSLEEVADALAAKLGATFLYEEAIE